MEIDINIIIWYNIFMTNTQKDLVEREQPSALEKLNRIPNIDDYYKRLLRGLIANIDAVSRQFGFPLNALAWVETIEERYAGVNKKDKEKQKEIFEETKRDILQDVVEIKKPKKTIDASEDELARMILEEAKEMQRVIQSTGLKERGRQKGHLGPSGAKMSSVVESY